jgi:hypothetical protein
MMLLSIDKVLEQAGGPAALRDLLERTGQPRPEADTISMWASRGVIPGWWSGCIIYALATQGVHPLHLLQETHPSVIRPEMMLDGGLTQDEVDDFVDEDETVPGHTMISAAWSRT